MPRDTPLWKAHDLSQQLQDKLEVLPNVGRAFVHVDHETSHHPVSLATHIAIHADSEFKEHRRIVDLKGGEDHDEPPATG